jgi:hypothetical protein
VNNVPILFSKYGADRRQRNIRRRADGIGREIVSQEKNFRANRLAQFQETKEK